MDPTALVAEQVEAGRRLAAAFTKFGPVRAAFWVRRPDEPDWLLHLAADRVTDETRLDAYGEVIRLLPPAEWARLDPAQVVVSNPRDPLAKGAAAAARHAVPAGSDVRVAAARLGDVFVAGAYIYAAPAAAAAA